MKMIEQLPELNWSERAKNHLRLADVDEIMHLSAVAFQLDDYAVAGLIYNSLTAPPWFWFLLAEGTTMRHLLDFRRKADMIPAGTQTAVEADDKQAIRFAEFYGFSPVAKAGDHIIMEKN